MHMFVWSAALRNWQMTKTKGDDIFKQEWLGPVSRMKSAVLAVDIQLLVLSTGYCMYS